MTNAQQANIHVRLRTFVIMALAALATTLITMAHVPDSAYAESYADDPYTYEMYVLGSADLPTYSGCTTIIYFKTDHPEGISMNCSRGCWSVYGTNYADLDLDLPSSTTNVLFKVKNLRPYKVDGGFIAIVRFDEVGTHTISLQEYDTAACKFRDLATFQIRVEDYTTARDAWMDSVLATLAAQPDWSSLDPFGKMSALSDYLLDNFTYLDRTQNGANITLAKRATPFFVCLRWDSMTSPYMLCLFAKKIGGFDDIHDCYGDYPRGSDEWYMYHFLCRVTIGDDVRYYMACPDSGTSVITSYSMVDFTDTASFVHYDPGALRYIPKHATYIDGGAQGEAEDTAAKISSTAFETSDWAILATNKDFADAMSASGLAGALDAPILLTDPNYLPEATKTELRRLGVKNVYIIGGKGAIPGDIEGELASIGVTGTVERVYGEEYYDTSVKCANKIAEYDSRGERAIVAYGQNFQDALSISSFAYKFHIPILLQTTGETSADRGLTAEQIELLTTGTWAEARVYVPGGPGAVSTDSVEGVLGDLRGGERIYGQTGYDTSNALAEYFVENGLLSPEAVCIATGAEAAKGLDALAGAALAGKHDGVILLTSAQPAMEAENYTTIDNFLVNNATAVANCWVLGGTYVLPDAFRDKVARLLASA